MAFNIGAVFAFVNGTLIPAVNRIMASVPGLLTANETNIVAALEAVQNVLDDVRADIATLIAAAKGTTTT